MSGGNTLGVGQAQKLPPCKFDNWYDMLFDQNGNPKPYNAMKIKGESLDLLETEAKNIEFLQEIPEEAAPNKLVNPLPKFQSVPATPHFFDLASAYITYPDLSAEQEKYKPSASGGLLGKLTGFWRK